MHNYFHLFSKWLSLSVMLVVTSACSSFLNLEDDSQPFFRTVREAIKLNEPRMADKALMDAPVPAAKPLQMAPAEPVIPNVMPAVVVPKASAPVVVAVAAPAIEEQRSANAKMLFAPYVPSLREGEAPRKWQKKPIYDFPWIAGAQPVRINEETIVGFGDQMLGRLYARAVFADRTTDSSWLDAAPVAPEAPAVVSDKKSRKNAQNKPVELVPVVNPAPKKKSVLQCDAGAPCLDVARDILVEDAAAKGWEMLLNRRVSLHNAFQFAKGERVVWIELTSNGGHELEMEYTLLPVQSNLQRR
jgi:hypothetical protein